MSTPSESMSAMRSSGVQRAFGGSPWREFPMIATSPPFASFSRLTECQSPPFAVACQKHCGVTWAWMSMLRMTRSFGGEIAREARIHLLDGVERRDGDAHVLAAALGREIAG